jgi:hypothetical protein
MKFESAKKEMLRSREVAMEEFQRRPCPTCGGTLYTEGLEEEIIRDAMKWRKLQEDMKLIEERRPIK